MSHSNVFIRIYLHMLVFNMISICDDVPSRNSRGATSGTVTVNLSGILEFISGFQQSDLLFSMQYLIDHFSFLSFFFSSLYCLFLDLRLLLPIWYLLVSHLESQIRNTQTLKQKKGEKLDDTKRVMNTVNRRMTENIIAE